MRPKKMMQRSSRNDVEYGDEARGHMRRPLLDHLVGERENFSWDLEVERLGGVEIED
jgi:hypothetical protein